MTNRDEKLDHLIKSLPRELARNDFTRRVIERLEESRPPVFSPYKIALVSATALTAIVIGLFAVFYLEQRAERDQLRNDLDTVKAQYLEIAQQLNAIKNQPSSDPLIYVGSDDKADYVLDISKLQIRLTGRDVPQLIPTPSDVFDLDTTNQPTYPSAAIMQASYKGGAI